jgi:hypothetical protein
MAMAARVAQDLATSTSQKNLHGPLPPLPYVPDSDSNRVQFGGEGDEGKKRRTQCPIPKNAANALLNTCGWHDLPHLPKKGKYTSSSLRYG